YGVLSVLWGNDDGTFRTPTYPGTYWVPLSAAVAAGDFNNDGNSDLVISEYDLEWGNAQVGARLGNGQGGFTPPGWMWMPAPMGAVTVADLNLDDKLDVVLAAPIWNGSTGYALLGNGDGTFSYDPYNSEFSATGDVRGLAVGDFTG